jgi:isoquinoline 1-oxidoreductase beta subunit
MKRRTLLASGLAGAGALLVGWSLLPPRARLGSAGTLPVVDGEIGLNGWIKIARDGSVRLAMARSEMGQGVHTALATLVAEELDVPLERVVPVEAGVDGLYANLESFVGMALWFHPRDHEPGGEAAALRASGWMVRKLARELGVSVTGGSTTIADAWEPLRLAAATARAQLVGAASLQWKLPVAELEAQAGVVGHPRSGRRAHYGELAAMAAGTRPGTVRLKPRDAWTLIGRPAPRLDAAAKSDGRARFGIDVRLQGLLFAVVRHAPAIGGSPGHVDPAPALSVPGVLRVVRVPPYAGADAAVAVVGRTTWHAMRGARALVVDWRPRPAGALDSAAILQGLERRAREAATHRDGFAFHDRGDARTALRDAERRIESVYRAPYLAHATMEPLNCTARAAEGRVELWVPTQVPGLARALAAKVAGIDEDAVQVHVTYLGGGLGRRLDIDVVGQAVRIALECGGAPVQLVWPREEDIAHDFYRPAAAAVLRAGFDARGRVTALAADTAGDAVSPRWRERALPRLAGPPDLPDRSTSEGLFDLPYAVPNLRIAHTATRNGVPVGYWRSAGHSHNAFFAEGFVDELAHAARQDPVAFRLALLDGLPRHAAVLRLAAAKAGWGTPLPTGRARGAALHASFGSIVAQVLEVGLDAGEPRVHRVVCAIDCGTVVNPGIVAQQMESGVVFGLTAALHGRIDLDGGVVRQKNFPDYPLLTLARTPRIETHIVASTHPPAGVGEPGVPPVAPALANALFALTGQRLRELPLSLASASLRG